jgi:hypothetical protein
MNLSTNAFWIGLPGWIKRSRTPVRAHQAKSARPVNSGPLSMTISAGRPCGRRARRARARPARRRSRAVGSWPTALSNQIRAFCLEYGTAMRRGAGLLKLDVATALENDADDLTPAMRLLVASPMDDYRALERAFRASTARSSAWRGLRADLADLLTCFCYPDLERRKAVFTSCPERRFPEIRIRTRPMGTSQDGTSMQRTLSPCSCMKSAITASPPSDTNF